jgi:LacI family transcriptional regulator
MRVRVQRVIDGLDYRPSSVARALVSGRSKTIGLLVSDIANPFYPQLAKSIERASRAHGYGMDICNTDDDVEQASAIVRSLLDRGVEGLIHASVGRDEEAVLGLVADPRRIVFANRRPRSSEVSYVVADNVNGAAEITRHLVEMGHRRIGFVSGPDWAGNARERLEGFLTAARDGGAEALVVAGDFSADSGAAAVRQWFAMEEPPTAVLGVNDAVAIGAIGALAEVLSIGTRVAVAGFDDTDLAGSRIIGLTSEAQQIGEMGECAADLLLEQLAGRTSPPVHLVLQPTLRVRRSTSASGIWWGPLQLAVDAR